MDGEIQRVELGLIQVGERFECLATLTVPPMTVTKVSPKAHERLTAG